MYSRANKGLWNGAPIPLGYKWDAKGKYPVIDEDTAVVVRYIYDQYEKIHSTMKLSDKLNRENIKSARGGEWTGTTVKGILRNPFYKGTYRYNYKTQTGRIKPVEEQIIHEDNHPGIIDKEQWDRVNKILDENSTRSVAQLRSNVKYTHIFSKLLRCGQCGHTMGGGLDRARSDGYRPSRYYCTSHTRKAGCTNGVYSDVCPSCRCSGSGPTGTRAYHHRGRGRAAGWGSSRASCSRSARAVPGSPCASARNTWPEC